MRSEAGMSLTGYQQPAQARAFGRVAVIAATLLLVLLLSIRLTSPPAIATDAGRTATFVVRSIPLDRQEQPPQPARADPARSAVSAPPSVAAPGSAEVPSPRSPPAAPVTVTLPGAFAAPALRPMAGSLAASTFPPAPATPAASAAPPASSTASAAADWRARLLGHLKRYRRYPRQAEAARQQGISRVAITLRRSGEVVAAELVRGSGYPLLDMEARATVRRASPVPPPDDAIPGDPVTVEVPIDFALRR